MGKSVLSGHIKAFQTISLKKPRPSEMEALTESHKFVTESHRLVPGQT